MLRTYGRPGVIRSVPARAGLADAVLADAVLASAVFASAVLASAVLASSIPLTASGAARAHNDARPVGLIDILSPFTAFAGWRRR
jgi:hypothetical protein